VLFRSSLLLYRCFGPTTEPSEEVVAKRMRRMSYNVFFSFSWDFNICQPKIETQLLDHHAPLQFAPVDTKFLLTLHVF